MRSIIVLFITFLTACASAEDFSITINRTTLEGNSLRGTISVNGQNIGPTLENDEFRIPPGRYSGAMRYESQKNFVQGSGGEMGDTGDFLLEIAGVKDWMGRPRTSILFHGGSKPTHSEGCILLGPVGRAKDGKPVISKEHPLFRLRVLFYGTETPNASPNKSISIEVIDQIDREEINARQTLIGSWVAIGGKYARTVWTFSSNGSMTQTNGWNTEHHTGKWSLRKTQLRVTMSVAKASRTGTVNESSITGVDDRGNSFSFRKQ